MALRTLQERVLGAPAARIFVSPEGIAGPSARGTRSECSTES
jgi:hypothetical protein